MFPDDDAVPDAVTDGVATDERVTTVTDVDSSPLIAFDHVTCNKHNVVNQSANQYMTQHTNKQTNKQTQRSL